MEYSSGLRFPISVPVFFGVLRAFFPEDRSGRCMEHAERGGRQLRGRLRPGRRGALGDPRCPMENRWVLPGETGGFGDANHGKTMGKPWENHGKTMGKPWENHGKMVISPSFAQKKMVILMDFHGMYSWRRLDLPKMIGIWSNGKSTA